MKKQYTLLSLITSYFFLTFALCDRGSTPKPPSQQRPSDILNQVQIKVMDESTNPSDLTTVQYIYFPNGRDSVIGNPNAMGEIRLPDIQDNDKIQFLHPEKRSITVIFKNTNYLYGLNVYLQKRTDIQVGHGINGTVFHNGSPDIPINDMVILDFENLSRTTISGPNGRYSLPNDANDSIFSIGYIYAGNDTTKIYLITNPTTTKLDVVFDDTKIKKQG